MPAWTAWHGPQHNPPRPSFNLLLQVALDMSIRVCAFLLGFVQSSHDANVKFLRWGTCEAWAVIKTFAPSSILQAELLHDSSSQVSVSCCTASRCGEGPV